MAQRNLLREQFVKLQTPPSGRRALGIGVVVGVRGWVVKFLDRLRKARKIQGCEKFAWHEVDQINVKNRPVDSLSEPGLGDAFARGVDRREGLGELGVFGGTEFYLRVNDFR